MFKSCFLWIGFLIPFFCMGQTGFVGFSVNPKVGVFNNNSDEGGFLAGFEFSKIKNNTTFSVDYFLFGEFTLMDPIPADMYNQIGLTIGKFNQNRYFRLQYQAGIAPFFGKMHKESISGIAGTPSYRYYETNNFFTIGLAGKLAFKFLPLKQLALGIDLQTNLNFKNCMFFPCLSLEIGKLRP